MVGVNDKVSSHNMCELADALARMREAHGSLPGVQPTKHWMIR